MHAGIFAKTFSRPSVDNVLDAVAALGIPSVQFNMACAGLASMPDAIAPDICARIRYACERLGIQMAAVSGTFNMIHPDTAKRAESMRRLEVLAASCNSLGTNLITLSTGTRDPENMWRRHADNDSTDAWQDLCESMQTVVQIAERHDIHVAFEPEVSNVIDSAVKGRRLLDEIQSPRLHAVIDGANLFHAGELSRMHAILDEAFDLLGDAVALAHAKDLSSDGEAGHEAAGTGVLDYTHYLGLLRRIGYSGPLILHNLTEAQVPESLRFLQSAIARTYNAP